MAPGSRFVCQPVVRQKTIKNSASFSTILNPGKRTTQVEQTRNVQGWVPLPTPILVENRCKHSKEKGKINYHFSRIVVDGVLLGTLLSFALLNQKFCFGLTFRLTEVASSSGAGWLAVLHQRWMRLLNCRCHHLENLKVLIAERVLEILWFVFFFFLDLYLSCSLVLFSIINDTQSFFMYVF